MTPEIRAVLKLQSLDQRAAALQKEILALPKHVAEIEKKLESHLRKLEIDKAALQANHKDRKNLEDEIKVQQQKISKLREQTLQAKTNDQYRAFQHEIEYCEKEIRRAEDRIIELMSASEPLEKNVKATEALLAEQKARVQQEQDHARKRGNEDQEFLKAALEERQQIASSVEPKLLAQYEHIRRRWKGIAVSDATSGKCSECRMVLRPQFFQDLKTADRLFICESCGRILYYNPPVDLQHELHQRA
ncbi:MAG TPA: C4-type zinc ribbon domain-containing protein [Bryobacteraceae bacterium]|nr:C4-type zinc ribbon domain-containing protein [Bryobacteraceae bacterium]